MKEHIKKSFNDFIDTHNITSENLDVTIKILSYTTFFNEITESILGTPDFTHDKTPDTTGSMVYLADATKEKMVSSLSILSVNSLYYGIICNNTIDFNYPNFSDFALELKALRLDIKRKITTLDYESDEADRLNLIQILIKMYMNSIYGMIDNPTSILTSSMENPRKFIVESAKTVMLMLVSYLINKGFSVYYMDTDEIHTDYIDKQTLEGINSFFEGECKDLINTSLSTIDVEPSVTAGYYIAKKRFITADKISARGMTQVDKNTVSNQNKKFFGRNFPDIFPEYAL